MQIDISEDTYTAIASRFGDVSAFVERTARQAIEAIDESRLQNYDPEKAKASLLALRKDFVGISLDEFMTDAREGLEQ